MRTAILADIVALSDHAVSVRFKETTITFYTVDRGHTLGPCMLIIEQPDAQPRPSGKSD
jgi:hypothetical protein